MELTHLTTVEEGGPMEGAGVPMESFWAQSYSIEFSVPHSAHLSSCRPRSYIIYRVLFHSSSPFLLPG